MFDISQVIIDFVDAIRHWADDNNGLAAMITIVVFVGFMIISRLKKSKSSGTTEGSTDDF